MFVGITNAPRPYAWGSRTRLAEFLGREPSGHPEAEVWLGAHPESPSRILDPSSTGGHERLDTWIAADPERALGAERSSDELPFLMKLLAAEDPLSIQVHPDEDQAREGYDAENARGIPLDRPERTYKDSRHKPEIALAVDAPFDALAGFRPLDRTRLLLQELIRRSARRPEARRQLVELEAQLAGPPGPVLRRIMDRFFDEQAAPPLLDAMAEAVTTPGGSGDWGPEIDALAEIARRRPDDPGLLVALLLNRITLEQDQAVYVAPGDVHAYLHGLAVEVMAASDNVVRGGLTSKHVDVSALRRIARFHESPQPVHDPDVPAHGVAVYRPRETDFQLAVLAPSPGQGAGVALTGPAIALGLSGAPRLSGRHETTSLAPGQAVYLTPDEQVVHAAGQGRIAVAMPGDGTGRADTVLTPRQ